MLRCILGERKSGKSEFVEEQVKGRAGSILYAATLPNLNIYKEVIARHRERRPRFWDCIELFEMTAREIAAFPYPDYRYVIIDNLSYYVLFQRFHNAKVFLRECDERFLSLIDKMAMDRNTTACFIDTPIEEELLKCIDEEGVIRKLFIKILDKSQVIERFYHGGTVCQMSVENGKDYIFRT